MKKLLILSAIAASLSANVQAQSSDSENGLRALLKIIQRQKPSLAFLIS